MLHLILPFIICFSPELQAEVAEPVKIPAVNWKANLKSDLVRSLCEGKGYYQSCYEVTSAQCQEKVRANFESCAARVTLNTDINPQLEGLEWAKKIGYCVGQATEKGLSKRKNASEKCADLKAWL
jgi:hypothetical protein